MISCTAYKFVVSKFICFVIILYLRCPFLHMGGVFRAASDDLFVLFVVVFSKFFLFLNYYISQLYFLIYWLNFSRLFS